MDSLKSLNIPSASSVLSLYASLSTSMMLVQTVTDKIIPLPIRNYLFSKLQRYFSRFTSTLTLVIDEVWCGKRNELFDAAKAYLATKIGPANLCIEVGKLQEQSSLVIDVADGEEIVDTSFENIKITWSYSSESKRKFYELKFPDRYREKVMGDYLVHILNTYRSLEKEKKVLKIYTYQEYGASPWKSMDLQPPSTFETLAFDPELKKTIIDDLNRFIAGKDFYKKVGKIWKRGYLLYGPPGTGKSSLIAAMANYLKFDIYDLELASIRSNSDLRKALMTASSRSILVIEDIDCNSEVHDRLKVKVKHDPYKTLQHCTLSGVLNIIDGMWSSCGEERIIVFTTNHKEILDPALLRPGRMDMHINLSFCTPQGFRILASNYLDIQGGHPLFEEIEGLLAKTEASPASISEELIKSKDADVALDKLVSFLKRKRMEEDEGENQDQTRGTKMQKTNEETV